jgi:predicted N-acetyltransferase YhbS
MVENTHERLAARHYPPGLAPVDDRRSVLDTPDHKLERRHRLLPAGFEMRLATEDDVAALVKLGKEQFETSRYADHGVEYSEAQAERYLTMVLEHMLIPHIVAVVDGEIIGGISFSYDHSFSKKPIAVMQNFFVTKKYRRSLVGRYLMSAALEIAKDEQACAFFAPVNNGGAHIGSLENLLGKAGFRMSGYLMTRAL